MELISRFLRAHRVFAVAVIGATYFVVAAAVALQTFRLVGTAGSECNAYEAGGLFGLFWIEMPSMAVWMWLAAFIPVGMALPFSGRVLVAAAVLGLVLAAAIEYWYLVSKVAEIKEFNEFCEGGLPAWWPPWLPR